MSPQKNGAGAPPPTTATEPPGFQTSGLLPEYRQPALIGIQPVVRPTVTLRGYQREGIRACREALNRGVRRQLLAMPTGSGKTVWFSGLCHLRSGPDRCSLIIVHREELATQAERTLRNVAPHLRVGIVRANRNEHTGFDVVIATIQTICRPKRLAQLIGKFTTVVVDEAHHAVAPTYVDTLRALGCFDDDGPLLVGVTATAGERSDGVGLDKVFQEIVYQRGILYMIAQKYLVDVRALEIESKLDLGNVKNSHGDFDDAALGVEMDESGAILEAAHAYGQYARNRRGVAFTPTVANAHALANCLRGLGISAEAVSGETPSDERRAILGRLSTGETQVVANCAILTEGFDEPALSCALIARPTKSRPLFIQMAGRVLRKHPTKTDALLLVMSAPPEAGLATIADLAGDGRYKPKSKDETLGEAAQRVLLEEAAFGDRVPAQRLSARQVDLFAASRLRWLPAATGFALPAKNTTLLLVPDGDDWRVVELPTRGEPVEMVNGLSLEMAQGVGEEFARARGGVISRADARWRAQKVSDGQRHRLARLRLAVPSTSGEASDAIAVAEAEQALHRLMAVAS